MRFFARIVESPKTSGRTPLRDVLQHLCVAMRTPAVTTAVRLGFLG